MMEREFDGGFSSPHLECWIHGYSTVFLDVHVEILVLIRPETVCEDCWVH